MPASLECAYCASIHDSLALRCSCGGPLDRSRPLPAANHDVLRAWRRDPIRRAITYGDYWGLPPASVPTLGEGATPLVHDPKLDCWFKLEYLNPTGSFKDRGAAAVVGHARAAGARVLVEDSSGNAGSAVAAYAAQAGMTAIIFIPKGAHQSKVARMQALGADVRTVDGNRRAVTEAAFHAASAPGHFLATHTWTPWFLEGCRSIGYEVADQLGQAPDWWVAPVAMGSMLLGAHAGFRDAHPAGQSPRTIAVQAAGFAPLVAGLPDGGRHGNNRLADGVQVKEPARLDQMRRALQDCNGDAIEIGEDANRAAWKTLLRRGWLVEATSALAYAGVLQARRGGHIAKGDTVAVPLSGSWKG